MPHTSVKAEIVSRRDITQDLMIVRLRPEAPFPFAPGRHVIIQDSEDPKLKRAYSIASAPHEDTLELFIELFEDGKLTPKLWKLRAGDAVTLFNNRGMGRFLFEPAYRNQVMVATVTGVAPFVSMVRMLSGCGFYRFYIFQGASYHDEFGFDHVLSQFKDVVYIPTVSQENKPRNAGWQGETKRVNLRVEDFLARHNLVPDNATMCYACGHGGMIADVRQRLEQKGWVVKYEEYFRNA